MTTTTPTYFHLLSSSTRSDVFDVSSTWKRSMSILVIRQCNVIPTYTAACDTQRSSNSQSAAHDADIPSSSRSTSQSNFNEKLLHAVFQGEQVSWFFPLGLPLYLFWNRTSEDKWNGAFNRPDVLLSVSKTQST